MGGKSRKTGTISKKLIDRLKKSGIQKQVSQKSNVDEKKKQKGKLFD